jgi:hypothetical protein
LTKTPTRAMIANAYPIGVSKASIAGTGCFVKSFGDERSK